MTTAPLPLPLPSHNLAAEKELTARLIATLQQEQALLSGHSNADQIPDVISAKARLVAEMAERADQRHQALDALAFPASENGMQSWLDQHGSHADQQLWDELFALAQSAREINRLNGLLVGKQMAINQNALHILQGHANVGTSLYGPDGSSRLRTIGRPLGIG